VGQYEIEPIPICKSSGFSLSHFRSNCVTSAFTGAREGRDGAFHRETECGSAVVAATPLKAGLRVRVRRSDTAERRAESENLSQRGVFFATDLPLSQGASLDLLVEMPEEITGVPAAQWLCTGHVVRIVAMDSPKGAHGVGVQFDFYEVSRSERPQWAPAVGLRGPVAPVIERR
jgi:hypothetical protein